MKRLIVTTLLTFALCSPSYANSITINEQAAVECENPNTVDEFAHGNKEACYDVMIGEITSARASRIEGVAEDEEGWDCNTMGNKICGTQPVAVQLIAPITLTQLPRTN